MTRTLFSTERPKAETLWSELEYWQARTHALLAAQKRPEAHLVMRQELAPRMRQWSEVCGLSLALQRARLRHLLRGIPAAEQPSFVAAPSVRTSAPERAPSPAPAGRPRIPLDDIAGMIDAVQADDPRAAHAWRAPVRAIA